MPAYGHGPYGRGRYGFGAGAGLPPGSYGAGAYGAGPYGGFAVFIPPPPPVFETPVPGVSAVYQIKLFDVTGKLIAVLDDWNSLYYYKRINDFGYHTLSIDGASPRRALFAVDTIIEVWRRNAGVGIPWTLEYAGFHRTDQDQVTDRGQQLFTSYGRSYEDLLHRRAILYNAGSPGDTKTGPLDNVIKAYVRENAGSSALMSNDRLRDGVTLGLTVSPNTSQAPTWSGSNAWKNLLTAIQDMVKTTDLDFSVRRTGPASFVFDTAWPRIGTDRSGAGPAQPVVFSLAKANMSAPYGTVTRTDEFNVVIVLGPGAEDARTFTIRTDATAGLASPWNSAEKTSDQRNITDPDALDAAGDAQLVAGHSQAALSFTALDTNSTAYGRDFFIGDVILSQFHGLVLPKKIVGVENTVANGQENLRIHFDDEVNTLLAGVA